MNPFIVSLIFFLNTQTATFSPHAECWKRPREFFPKGELASSIIAAFENAVSIKRTFGKIEQPFEVSANQAYAYHVTHTPNLSAPSGTTTVKIVIFVEKPYLVSIDAINIGGVPDIAWINDKLLYIRFWLGRLYAVDVIYDVESENYVHKEAVANGNILFFQTNESCKQSTNREQCYEDCYHLPE